MGWNSWNHYHCAVDEAILRNISRLYQTTGVAAAGYQYVNIDVRAPMHPSFRAPLA